MLLCNFVLATLLLHVRCTVNVKALCRSTNLCHAVQEFYETFKARKNCAQGDVMRYADHFSNNRFRVRKERNKLSALRSVKAHRILVFDSCIANHSFLDHSVDIGRQSEWIITIDSFRFTFPVSFLLYCSLCHRTEATPVQGEKELFNGIECLHANSEFKFLVNQPTQNAWRVVHVLEYSYSIRKFVRFRRKCLFLHNWMRSIAISYSTKQYHHLISYLLLLQHDSIATNLIFKFHFISKLFLLNLSKRWTTVARVHTKNELNQIVFFDCLCSLSVPIVSSVAHRWLQLKKVNAKF